VARWENRKCKKNIQKQMKREKQKPKLWRQKSVAHWEHCAR
jgi:hypothetical protein